MNVGSNIQEKPRRQRVKSAKIKETHSNESILTIEEVCTALTERGGFTGSYEDLVKHVRIFFGEMKYQLSDGFTENSGYFSVNAVVDKSRYSLRKRILLRRLAGSAVIDIEEKAERQGYIKYFTDIATGTENDRLTPNSKFIVTGKGIKVEGKKAECGVWFISTVDNSLRFKVTSALIENSKDKICGIVPVLPNGKYNVEIKTQYTESGILLKKPQTIKGKLTLRNYKILSIKDEEKEGTKTRPAKG